MGTLTRLILLYPTKITKKITELSIFNAFADFNIFPKLLKHFANGPCPMDRNKKLLNFLRKMVLKKKVPGSFAVLAKLKIWPKK
jgi:hypothetical protein